MDVPLRDGKVLDEVVGVYSWISLIAYLPPMPQEEGDPTLLIPAHMVSTSDVCSYCGEYSARLQRCSACKSNSYCSKECQKLVSFD
jgi:hypothetical protein